MFAGVPLLPGRKRDGLLNAELRAAFKEDPSSLSADDRARAEQLLARDARKAAKKAARTSESA